MLNEYGIIGFPLKTTFSPTYFNNKFNAEKIDAIYNAYPLNKIEEFTQLIKSNPALKGLSVTIPHKETVIKYLDDIDTNAAKIGAVNCIKIENGKTKGFNTDIIGFELSLKPLLNAQHNKALVLGNGGAAKAVKFVLNKLGIKITTVSRNKNNTFHNNVLGTINYEELTESVIKDNLLIINTTPLGMYPDVDSYPVIPYNAIGINHLLYDLIYKPETTRFLELGNKYNAITKNGYEMLLLQADAAWEIWSH